MTLGVAVIGLGQIGLTSDLTLDPDDYVFSHSRAFHLHDAYELVAGVDKDENRRLEFERAYCTPSLDVVDGRLRALAPDVVVIAVPTHMHIQVLKDVLSNCNPRVVLCEKPLAYDLTEAREIVSMCERASCDLYVNYVRRADLAVQEIRRRIDDGDILTPVKGIAWYSKGLFNNGSHFIDLLRVWLGEIQSFQIVQKGRILNEDPEPDVLIDFAKGQVYFMAAKEENFSHYTIELVSPNGRLHYDRGGTCVTWQAAVVSNIEAGYTKLDANKQEIKTGMDRIQWHVAEQMINVLRGKPTTLCTGHNALSTMENLSEVRSAL